MTTQTITADNLNEVANGTKVIFNYGVGCGSEHGWVVGRETNRWGSHLIAMTHKGKMMTINRFTTVGVGVYLA